MSIRNLAECIILQSLIDISEPSAKTESLDFLRGRRLVDCARIAGMDSEDISSLRKFARRYIRQANVCCNPARNANPAAPPKARKAKLSSQCSVKRSGISRECGI